jgi:hypothetical protein
MQRLRALSPLGRLVDFFMKKPKYVHEKMGVTFLAIFS